MKPNQTNAHTPLLGWILIQPLVVLILHRQIRPIIDGFNLFWVIVVMLGIYLVHTTITRSVIGASGIRMQPKARRRFCNSLVIGMAIPVIFPGTTTYRLLLPIIVFTACSFWNVLQAKETK